MSSTTMSKLGWICSILRMRQMNSDGLLGSPYMPPMDLSSTARSIMVSADRPKHFSFQ
jgi:hypothetical protein